MADKAQTLENEYQLRFSDNSDYRHALWRILCRDFFQRFIAADATVLDLGCGWGEFINNIQAARKYGMDLNPESGRLLAADVRFLQQDCSRPWEVPAESLDVVFTSNFLEHLPDKASVSATSGGTRLIVKLKIPAPSISSARWRGLAGCRSRNAPPRMIRPSRPPPSVCRQNAASSSPASSAVAEPASPNSSVVA